MIVTPTSELATAVRENLRRAVLDKESCWGFKKIPPLDSLGSGFKIHDSNNIIMYACKYGNEYKLNNLNGPAFHHLTGSREIFFINNQAYPEFVYNKHYAIKLIKGLKLATPNQPIVGSGVYPLINGYLNVSLSYDNITLRVYNRSGELHNEDGPARIDFVFKHSIEYYKNGSLHNTKGPAVISYIDEEEKTLFFINGKELTPNEYKQLVKDYDPADIDIYTDLNGI